MAESKRPRQLSEKLNALLSAEQRPNTLREWRKQHQNLKLTVMFENGEERMVDIKKVEPGDDVFEKPQPGDEVCCNISGGRYSAVVLECIHAEDKVVETQKAVKQGHKSLKRQAITSEIDTAAKKAKQIDKDLTSLRAATREKAQIQLIEQKLDLEMPKDGVSVSGQELTDVLATALKPLKNQLDNIVQRLDDLESSSCAAGSLMEKLESLADRLENMADKRTTTTEPMPLSSSLSPLSPHPSPDKKTKRLSSLIEEGRDILKEEPEPIFGKDGFDQAQDQDLGQHHGPDRVGEDKNHGVSHGHSDSNGTEQSRYTCHVEYVSIGGLKIPKAKLQAAKRCGNSYKMARRLLPEFFTPQELQTCTCVPPRSGCKVVRPQANGTKLGLLLSEVRKVYPGGWDEKRMLSSLNQAFIDNRKKK